MCPLQLGHASLAVAVLLCAVALGTPAAQGDFAGLFDIGGAVGCTREARAVRRSSLKLATAAPPGSGARTSTSPGRRRWVSRAWPLSPVVAPMIDQGGDAPQRQRPPEPQRPRRHAADRPWTPLLTSNTAPRRKRSRLFIPLRRPSLGGSLSGSTPAPTRDVLGLVLVDAYSETLETLLTPQRWAALARSTCSPAATR
jgi:hypothetical protein